MEQFKYLQGVRDVTTYFEEKQAMGMLLLTWSSPKHYTLVLVAEYLRVGSYLEVIEPWLKQFVRDHSMHCKVEASSPCGSSVVLRLYPVDYEVVVTLEVTSCGKRGGEVRYV